jgi:hypothetical protein
MASTPGSNSCRFELTLPKQHTVRVPWDATRGPRSMALIEKMFPDQGIITLRGRVSHWMSAWDNVAAWIGLPPDLYSENLLTRLKYAEHLSHGQFPWSGAGDEFGFVIRPAAADTPPARPAVVGALRCWQPHDTQEAVDQFLASLSLAAKERLWAEPAAPGGDGYVIHARAGEQVRALCHYRYAGGLVIAAESAPSLQRFDPARFDGQALQTVDPENEFYCKTAELGAFLGALSAFEEDGGGGVSSRDLNAAAEILKAMSELRLTIRVEKETVRYALEVRML